MADNYLEKKMEEHRRGVVIKRNMHRMTPGGDRPGTVSFSIDMLRVLVTDGSGKCGVAIINRLREAGCKVAFSMDDEKAGRTLAQKSGARFYPASFTGSISEDLEKAWGGLDAVVVTDGCMPAPEIIRTLRRLITVGVDPELSSACGQAGLTINAIDVSGREPADVANICLILCLNASECIDGRVL